MMGDEFETYRPPADLAGGEVDRVVLFRPHELIGKSQEDPGGLVQGHGHGLG